MGAHVGRVQGGGFFERGDRCRRVVPLPPGEGPRREQAGVDNAEGLVQPRVCRVDGNGALDVNPGGIVPAEKGERPGEVEEGARVLRVLFQGLPEAFDRFGVLPM